MAIKKPNPYIPAFMQAAASGSRPVSLTWDSVSDTNIASTSSFQYDSYNTPLKSTQQLNVDWSQFQNHTFFMSAEAKVNLAFNAIINSFPFDGTRQETEVFFESLSGFDNWVFENFPVFHGELMFSGTAMPSGSFLGEVSPHSGTYITTQNSVGGLFPELSKQNTGEAVLNPTGSQSMTIEMQLYLPPIPNDVQTICQLLSSSKWAGPGGATQGFSLYMTNSLSTSSVDAHFVVVSGSTFMSVPLTLNKGMFNHIAVELNRNYTLPYLESFLLSSPVASSQLQVEIGDMDIDNSVLLIGSGTAIQMGLTSIPGGLITPMQTLSGTIDEFRIFNSARTPQQQASYASKALYSTTDLILYYRFNEPPPPLAATLGDSINSIVLDSSGNSMHALINNYFAIGPSSSIGISQVPGGGADPNGTLTSPPTYEVIGQSTIGRTTFYTSSIQYAVGPFLRLDASQDPLSPITNERPDSCPVLFPAYPPTIAFNAELLASASAYDLENPNLITKLIPDHYLLEGAVQDGYIDPPEGNEGQPYGGSGLPGQGVMGNVQILVSLLYIWARFFDDMKLYVDSFVTVNTVDYNTNETVPDSFLMNLVNNMGFHLPPLFNASSLEQYIRGENVNLQTFSTDLQSLQQVQSLLLRRVLINLPYVLKSKGTQYSIQAFLRAIGIDPGNNIRIREFGGPTSQQLSYSRESKIEPGGMVQFFEGSPGRGLTNTGSIVVSPFLVAPRVEPGFPLPLGDFVVDPNTGRNTGTTEPNDTLLTSGSWTWEGIVKYTPVSVGMSPSSTQSLVRLCNTGSANDGSAGIIANLIAISSSFDPKLVLYVRPGDGANSPTIRLELDTPIPGYTSANDLPLGIFNADKWNVSFGRQRGDDGLGATSQSQYFLRLAYQNVGKVEYLETTSSFFDETPFGENNVLQVMNVTSSASGSFLAVGVSQFISAGTGSNYLYLNNILAAPDEARTKDFNGRLSNFRFWSRALTLDEWTEHVRNYNSTGVEDPLTNWNYANTATGSWNRLRLSSLVAQDNIQAISTASLETTTVAGPPDSPVGPTGIIVFPDFSENGFHLTGSGFPINTDIIVGESFELSALSGYFDEATCDEKVRVRSYLDFNLVETTPWAALAPVYEIPPSEAPTDDVRLIVEFSLIDSLNRDIAAIFATFDALDNALGAPELVFSPDYPDLENLRNIYFNRIKEKLNFQAFFEFFRWFDTSIGIFIQQLIPRKTRFKGTNFTVESHMLERAKQEYLTYDIYLGDSNRVNLNAEILLQQFDGLIGKY